MRALVRLRWPGGFVCPCCGHREHCISQPVQEADIVRPSCRRHSMISQKNGISSVERLGVQPTAWAVELPVHSNSMARREGEITGRVEMDDAYLGGVCSGGKRGRGAAGKTPFVAAVSTSCR